MAHLHEGVPKEDIQDPQKFFSKFFKDQKNFCNINDKEEQIPSSNSVDIKIQPQEKQYKAKNYATLSKDEKL